MNWLIRPSFWRDDLIRVFRELADSPQDHACALEMKERKSTKSREQEEKYHAIIGEIAHAKTLRGKRLPAESWKRLLIDAFKHETKGDPDLKGEWERFGAVELLPALNHDGFVMIGNQSRRFTAKLATAFIDWLHAFQDQWSDEG